MKKYSLISLLIIVMLAISGCGSNGNGNNIANNDNSKNVNDNKPETEKVKENEKEEEEEIEEWMVEANFDVTSETNDVKYFKGHDMHEVGDTAVIYNTDLKQNYELTVKSFFLTDQIANIEKHAEDNYFLVADVAYKNIGDEPMEPRYYITHSLQAVANGTDNPLTDCKCNLKDSQLGLMETIQGVSYNIQTLSEEDLQPGEVNEGQMVYEIEPTDKMYLHIVSGNDLETETFVFDLKDAEAMDGNIEIKETQPTKAELGEKVVMKNEEGEDELEVTLENPTFVEPWQYPGASEVDYGRKELRIDTVFTNVSDEPLDIDELFRYIGQSRLINDVGVQRYLSGAHGHNIKDENDKNIREFAPGDTVTIPLMFYDIAPFEGEYEVFYYQSYEEEVFGGKRWIFTNEDIEYGGFDRE